MSISITVKSLKNIIWGLLFSIEDIPSNLNLDFLDNYKLTTLLIQITSYDETGNLILPMSTEKPMPGTAAKQYITQLLSSLSN